MKSTSVMTRLVFLLFMSFVAPFHGRLAGAVDKLNFIYTARVMSQSYPYIAQEAGLLKNMIWTFPSFS